MVYAFQSSSSLAAVFLPVESDARDPVLDLEQDAFSRSEVFGHW
jgi:hypothetical protein